MHLLQTHSNILIFVVIAALILHAICFAMGRKIHVLFLLVGILGMATNISTSPSFEYFMAVKYLRVYLNVAIIILGFVLYRKHLPGSATIFLLISALLYWISGAWSLKDPTYYIVYNSFFFFSVLSGIFLANSVNTVERLHAGLRVLAGVGVFAGAFYLTMYCINPSLMTLQGRLASFGGCATTFSADCACFAVPSIYLVFFDTKKSLKPLWCFGIALLVLCILLSGSRTGLVLVFAGTMVFVYKKRKKPIITGTTIAFIVVILGAFMFSLDNIEILERYVTSGNTRSGVWMQTLEVTKQSSLFGFGSSFINGPNGLMKLNPHNCFIKMMHNCGILGLSFLLIAVGLLCMKVLIIIRKSRHNPQQAPLVTFLVAMTMVILLHMMPDHSILATTSVSSVWVGFVFGMSDRLARQTAPQLHARKVLVRNFAKQQVSCR